MYHYMTKKKGSFALMMILLVAEGVAGVFFSLVMSSLVDSAGKSGGICSWPWLGVSPIR